MVKYHGNDNSDSIYVSLELAEFAEQLTLDGDYRRFWDYTALFGSRAGYGVLELFVCLAPLHSGVKVVRATIWVGFTPRQV